VLDASVRIVDEGERMRSAAARWLVSTQVVSPRGEVWSWDNPEHPGHAYPEAGGLVLRWLASTDAHPELAARIAAWLLECWTTGSIGRDGREYLFDRGVVLAGLAEWRLRGGVVDRAVLRAMRQQIIDDVSAGRCVDPAPPTARWSTSFGPHLLKLAVGLRLTDHVIGDDGGVQTIARLVARTLRWSGPRVPTSPDGLTYLHALGYALEGLLCIATDERLPSATREQAGAAARAGARWIARVQLGDGSLPAWHDGSHASGVGRADASAQAIRIWCCLDRDAYRRPIEAAFAHLASLATARGGLRYQAESNDLNTWATLFALQALDFARGPARPEALW
jgi:hypothetical protein